VTTAPREAASIGFSVDVRARPDDDVHAQFLGELEDWGDILEKIKAAGFTAFAFYSSWAYHAPNNATVDFTTGARGIVIAEGAVVTRSHPQREAASIGFSVDVRARPDDFTAFAFYSSWAYHAPNNATVDFTTGARDITPIFGR
jgi:beta-galactosidase GanA